MTDRQQTDKKTNVDENSSVLSTSCSCELEIKAHQKNQPGKAPTIYNGL